MSKHKHWQAKEKPRWRGSSPQELGQAVEEGKIVLKVQPEKDRTKRTKPASRPKPTRRPTAETPFVRETTPPVRAAGETRAGKREYDQFFSLYAKWIREGKKSQHFLPLGFIPGPATILETGNDEVRVTDATPDVKEGMAIPSPRMKSDELPEKIRQALADWRMVGKALGGSLSPWNLGLARGVLEGRVPSESLVMAMTQFRYRAGDPERPLAITLTPTKGGMTVAKVYNPAAVPDVPSEGAVLSLDELRKGRGPVQKLVRTTSLMEGNYRLRYQEDGRPKTANRQRR